MYYRVHRTGGMITARGKFEHCPASLSVTNLIWVGKIQNCGLCNLKPEIPRYGLKTFQFS